MYRYVCMLVQRGFEPRQGTIGALQISIIIINDHSAKLIESPSLFYKT